ncbi:MAG TPA: hypothetical protein VLF90_02660 [Patescibacteria group bacterium]|nr:hypothetical protein [Patescibacteria group bacterium]
MSERSTSHPQVQDFSNFEQVTFKNGVNHVYGLSATGKKHHLSRNAVLESYGYDPKTHMDGVSLDQTNIAEAPTLRDEFIEAVNNGETRGINEWTLDSEKRKAARWYTNTRPEADRDTTRNRIGQIENRLSDMIIKTLNQDLTPAEIAEKEALVAQLLDLEGPHSKSHHSHKELPTDDDVNYYNWLKGNSGNAPETEDKGKTNANEVKDLDPEFQERAINFLNAHTDINNALSTYLASKGDKVAEGDALANLRELIDNARQAEGWSDEEYAQNAQDITDLLNKDKAEDEPAETSLLDSLETPGDDTGDTPKDRKKVSGLRNRWNALKVSTYNRATGNKEKKEDNESKSHTKRNVFIGAVALAAAGAGLYLAYKHGVGPFHDAHHHVANNAPNHLGPKGPRPLNHGVSVGPHGRPELPSHIPKWARGHQAAYDKLHAAHVPDAQIHSIIEHPDAFKAYINWGQHATEQLHKAHPNLSDEDIEKILKTRWDRYFATINRGGNNLPHTL